MLDRNIVNSKKSFFLTIYLGIVFSIVQILEYINVSFSLSDSVFGSTFFLITGFHGLHVIIGTIFLLVTFLRLSNLGFSSDHLLGFELAA